MLLRLSPGFVRPLRHTVHSAADAQRHQHPSYGAAGHRGGKRYDAKRCRVCEVSSLTRSQCSC